MDYLLTSALWATGPKFAVSIASSLSVRVLGRPLTVLGARLVFISVIMLALGYSLYRSIDECLSVPTFYDDLGVRCDAPDTEISKAYRKLAAVYHPDKFRSLAYNAMYGGFTWDTIMSAKECLTDRSLRFAYDRLGYVLNEWRQPGAPLSPLTVFKHVLLKSLFGYYGVALVSIPLLSAFNVLQSGQALRNALLLLTFTTELTLLTNPQSCWMGGSLTTFELVAILRKVSFNLSALIIQLSSLFSNTADGTINAATADGIASLSSELLREADNALLIETNPYPADAKQTIKSLAVEQLIEILVLSREEVVQARLATPDS